MYDMFTELINTPEKLRVAKRLAEIEAEDRDRCSNCGGEDCICCEIYLDRQRWQSPEEFFASDEWDYCEPRVDWVYSDEEWLEIPVNELCPNGYNDKWELSNAIKEWIRNDINQPDSDFEFDFTVLRNGKIEISNIFYIYD